MAWKSSDSRFCLLLVAAAVDSITSKPKPSNQISSEVAIVRLLIYNFIPPGLYLLLNRYCFVSSLLKMDFAMDSKFNMEEMKPLSLGETMRMIFYYRRPEFVPSSSAQRAFQTELNMLLSGNPDSQGLRCLPAATFEIPFELSFDAMMAGKTVPVRFYLLKAP